MRRAGRPLDRGAVQAANAALAKQHPELVRGGTVRPLSATDPADAAYRKAWMDNYAAAGGSVAQVSAGPDSPKTAAAASSRLTPAAAVRCSIDAKPASPPPPPAKSATPPPCELKSLSVTRPSDGIVVARPGQHSQLEMVAAGSSRVDKVKLFGGITMERPGGVQTAKPTFNLKGASTCGDHISAGWPNGAAYAENRIGGGYSGTAVIEIAEDAIARTTRDLPTFFSFWSSGDFGAPLATIRGSACAGSGTVAVAAYPKGEFKTSLSLRSIIEFIAYVANPLGEIVGELMQEDLDAAEDWRGYVKNRVTSKWAATSWEGDIEFTLGLEWSDHKGAPTVDVIQTLSGSPGITLDFHPKFVGRGAIYFVPFSYYIKPGFTLTFNGTVAYEKTAPVSAPDRRTGGFRFDVGGSLELGVLGGLGLIHEKVVAGEVTLAGTFALKVRPTQSDEPDAEQRGLFIMFDSVDLKLQFKLLDGLWAPEKKYVLFENENPNAGWKMLTLPDDLVKMGETVGRYT